MTTTSFGDIQASGDDRRSSSSESSAAGQPLITPGTSLISTDWLPGPSDGTQSPVVVSFTDFHADSEEDWQQVAEWRGGSLSIWDSRADVRRFIRWPVHAAIMNNWRGRIRVRSASWNDERFLPAQTWLRAEEHMRAPRDIRLPDGRWAFQHSHSGRGCF